MRIRKRQVPLPLSSLSPVPLSSLSLSDPNSSGSSLLPPVQLLLHSTAADCIHKNPEPSSDQATTSRLPIGGSDAIDRTEMAINGEEEKLISDDSSVLTPSKISGSTQVHRLSKISHRGGRWREGEKTSLLLKKRGNRGDDDEEEEGRGEGGEVKNVDITGTPDSKSIRSPSGGAKKRGRGARGGTVMEGSRCSRVNGRGWRCCQPTLVGYSLCEHHLGKGRLRSMTNVRSRRQTKPTTASPLGSPELAVLKLPKVDEEDEDYVEEKKTKKGAKLGVVKARSMSSLLGQDSNSSNANSSGATPLTATTVAVRSENAKDSSTDEA